MDNRIRNSVYDSSLLTKLKTLRNGRKSNNRNNSNTRYNDSMYNGNRKYKGKQNQRKINNGTGIKFYSSNRDM